MKTKFMMDGVNVAVLKINEEQLVDKLPPQVYNVHFSAVGGFYLSTVKEQLELPSKIYGVTEDRADKCLSTYQSRNSSTGILLTGDKGTGKTLLMSVLANKMITEAKLPVLLIKQAFAGDQFVTFIESIGECVIVFDEFGKMYASSDRHHNDNDVPQKALLSLMDGTDKTKRMFIMTENSEIDINEFMLNRPSRIYYHFRYKKLDEASIMGYCHDHNVNNRIVREIVDVSRRARIFSFDMLQSIVEEHLRFNCSVDAATADLNIDIREDRGALMEVVKVMERGTEVRREVFGNPVVTKPDNGYTYIKVKNADGSSLPMPFVDNESPELRKALQKAKKVLDSMPDGLEEEDSYQEVYVQLADLAYEQDGQLVFETDEFVFVARTLPPAKSDYMKYF